MTRPAFPVLLMTLLLAFPAMAASSSSSSSSSSQSRNSSSSHRESHSSSSHSDQDDARDALRRGKVMPLTAILEIVARREPGTVLDAELETEDGVLTYKIDLLSDAGRKVRFRLNARTGEILAVDYR
jgi:uncharacterized membrane protein YkoI